MPLVVTPSLLWKQMQCKNNDELFTHILNDVTYLTPRQQHLL
jgi:hypothetical protein